jgi:hypothetical protein
MYEEASAPGARGTSSMTVDEEEGRGAGWNASDWLRIADDLLGGHVSGDYPDLTWAKALRTAAAGLTETGCHERAVEVSDALFERFQCSADPSVRRAVIIGLHNKAIAMDRLGRDEEALGVHAAMTRRFGAEVVAAFDELIGECDRVGGDRAPEELATNLYSKAWALRDLGKPDEELAVLADLIGRFADNPDPSIQGVVADAREEHAKLSEARGGSP